MAEDPRKDALAKLEVATDPLRLAIVTSLTLQGATAAELATKLDAPLNRVRYQLRRLREAGIAELREVRPRRGVTEQVYFVRRSFISVDEVKNLPPKKLEKAIVEILRAVLRDALESLRAGVFYARDEFATVRTPLRLDNRGWLEAAELHEETMRRLLLLQEQAVARMEEGEEEEEAITAFSFLLLFEAARSEHR
jgi:DNA-binding transcriptional ArsR family regulator